jgi:hypothetical protein
MTRLKSSQDLKAEGNLAFFENSCYGDRENTEIFDTERSTLVACPQIVVFYQKFKLYYDCTTFKVVDSDDVCH